MTGFGRQALLAATIALGAAGAAQAQEAVVFPPSMEREPLLLWLQRETDIDPALVVSLQPDALTAVVSTFPAGGGQGPRIVLRAEALTEAAIAARGAVSWHVSLTADCAKRQVKLGDVTGYPRRNLLGDRKILQPAETAPRTPTPGSADAAALRYACERGFKGPFAFASLQPPAPAEEAEAEDAAPRPARPPASAKVPRPTAAPPAPSRPAAPPPPARKGSFAVQVGAAATEADARRLLTGMGDLSIGRPTRIETAVVNGATWRRALVEGFASQADAERFCAAVKVRGNACFVRPLR